MGFSLGGFMSGAATAVDSKMKSDKIEREAERSKVEDMIFKTSSGLFNNAAVIQATRTSERKKNDSYMKELLSSAPSLRGDSARQAYILGLDDGAREDLITMSLRVQDKNFNPEGRSFSDYLTAADDPIEYKDTTTLNEKVQGAVVPRPMDSSAYYGVSDTKDAEVDKIVDAYKEPFAKAYGFTMAHAQGLLDVATQEVKVQSFNIDWAHKKEMIAAEVAQVTAAVATAKLGTVKSELAVVSGMESRAANMLKKARDLRVQGSGIPTEALFNADKKNQAAWIASPEYAAVNKSIISDAVLYMEQHPVLEGATMKFLNDNFPGKYGGEVGKDNPVASLKPDTYYVGTFTNGRGVATGAQIQAAAKGKTGGKGNEGFEDIKVASNTAVEAKAVTPTQSTTAAATAMSALQASHAALLEKKSTVATSRGGRGAVVTGANIKAIEADMATLEKDPTSLESVKILSTVALDSDSMDDIEQAIEAIKVYTEEHKSEIKRGDSIPELSTITSKLRAALAEDTEGTSRKRGRGLGERQPTPEKVVESPNPDYNPNSMQVSPNRTSMKIAIEEGDAVKVQAILDNLERMLDENPSYDTKMKIGYMRGDGLRALKELVKGK